MEEDKGLGKSGTEIRKILSDVLLKADNHGFYSLIREQIGAEHLLWGVYI
jgi:hypothetical protein